MTTGTVELEIALHREGPLSWTIEVRGHGPRTDAEIRQVVSGALLDFEGLRRHLFDSAAYGRRLSEMLFQIPEIRLRFEEARAAADSHGQSLRVRLFVGPSAPELHDVRWETLQDPENGSPLLTSERVLFSRYLSSVDWRPVPVRPKTHVRALVVVANPSDVASYHPAEPDRPEGRTLPAIDVPAEVERARAALDPVKPAFLVSGEPARPVTLARLLDALRDGHDILYLVCHGVLVPEGPVLLLEDDDGNAAWVPGKALADHLHGMRELPRLVVLTSCQSAGRGDDLRSDDRGALSALGPRLAEAGVPAVLAMQADVTAQTAGTFLQAFFKDLRRDGQIDRAVAVGRAAVHQRLDWWSPVLFMRLKSGRIWFEPGFSGDFEKWPSLISFIEQGQCTPILGPAVTDALLGSRQELARRWAEERHFPMAPHERDNLPHVAQYLSVNQDPLFPRTQLEEYMRRELLARYGSELRPGLAQASLDEVMTEVGSHLRGRDATEPHKVLAELPFPIYITTHPGNLLAAALEAAGKEPQVVLCRWNRSVKAREWPRSVYEEDRNYRPTPGRPLVFHLYGRLPLLKESLVLTEDDYFDWLIAVSSNRRLFPPEVRRALCDTALLFMGFRLDEWEFRVLFRAIVNQEGDRRDRYAHVAAQVDPEAIGALEPDRARRYLESYFQTARISIFWGTSEEFVRELKAAWEVRRR